MHFYSWGRNGDLFGNHRMRGGSHAIIMASANYARDDGIQFARPANDIILSPGVNGVIAPVCIRAIRLLPTYDLIRNNEDRAWKLTPPILNVDPFAAQTSDMEYQVAAETVPQSSRLHRRNADDASRTAWETDE